VLWYVLSRLHVPRNEKIKRTSSRNPVALTRSICESIVRHGIQQSRIWFLQHQSSFNVSENSLLSREMMSSNPDHVIGGSHVIGTTQVRRMISGLAQTVSTCNQR